MQWRQNSQLTHTLSRPEGGLHLIRETGRPACGDECEQNNGYHLLSTLAQASHLLIKDMTNKTLEMAMAFSALELLAMEEDDGPGNTKKTRVTKFVHHFWPPIAGLVHPGLKKLSPDWINTQLRKKFRCKMWLTVWIHLWSSGIRVRSFSVRRDTKEEGVCGRANISCSTANTRFLQKHIKSE